MKSYCKSCDPKHFTIYGFCGNCKRKCECPLYEPKSEMSFADYEDFKKRWYEDGINSFFRGFAKNDT